MARGAALASLACSGGHCAPSRVERLSPEEASGEALPAVDHARVFFVGHSLINFTIPSMIGSIAESLGVAYEHDEQIMDGGALKMNWEEHGRAKGSNAQKKIPGGGFDVLVMTEAVDLDDMIRWMEPAKYGGKFYSLAVNANPKVRPLFYETWHERDLVRKRFGLNTGGNWRSYIDDDLGKWETIVRDINAAEKGPRLHMIPGGQALATLVDEIRAGRVDGLKRETDLFSDNVHLSPLGNYFLALVQFATIYRRNPAGATHQPEDEKGTRIEVAPETAKTMQRIAWDVVRGYSWSGVTTTARR